jgi:hypothetical protein
MRRLGPPVGFSRKSILVSCFPGTVTGSSAMSGIQLLLPAKFNSLILRITANWKGYPWRLNASAKRRERSSGEFA